MKAVNLIPSEERRAAGGALSGASGPTLGLLGVLVLALIVVVAYVSLSNTVEERRAAVRAAAERADATEAQAAALKPYGDVVALRDRAMATVTTLAEQRFDWPRLIGDLSRRVPADVTLTSVQGASSPADAADAVAAGEAVAAGPEIAVAGCTSDHRAVARLMDRLAGVRGVTDVVLGSSARGEGAAGDGGRGSGGSGGCPRADQFDLTLAMGVAG